MSFVMISLFVHLILFLFHKSNSICSPYEREDCEGLYSERQFPFSPPPPSRNFPTVPIQSPLSEIAPYPPQYLDCPIPHCPPPVPCPNPPLFPHCPSLRCPPPPPPPQPPPCPPCPPPYCPPPTPMMCPHIDIPTCSDSSSSSRLLNPPIRIAPQPAIPYYYSRYGRYGRSKTNMTMEQIHTKMRDVGDKKCTDERLREIMKESISTDLIASKLRIEQSSRSQFEGIWNVICTNGQFSYYATAFLFCEVAIGKVSCFAFRHENIMEEIEEKKQKSPKNSSS